MNLTKTGKNTCVALVHDICENRNIYRKPIVLGIRYPLFMLKKVIFSLDSVLLGDEWIIVNENEMDSPKGKKNFWKFSRLLIKTDNDEWIIVNEKNTG